MYCKNCGTDVTGMKFCPNCGMKVESLENEKQGHVTDDCSSAYISENKTKRTSPVNVGNAFAIVILLLQIIQMVILFITKEIPAWVNGGILGVIILDWVALSKSGIKGAWKIWGIFVTPVYLLLRAKKTDRKYVIPVASFICVLMSVGVMVIYIFGGNDSESLPDENSTNITATQNTGTALAREQAYNTGSALLSISGSVCSSEIVFLDAWECEGYPVEVYNLPTTDKQGSPDGSFLVSVIDEENDNWEYLDMSARFNALHEFTQEELMDYRSKCESIILNRYSAMENISEDASVTTDNSEGDIDEKSLAQDLQGYADSPSETEGFEGYYTDEEQDELYIVKNEYDYTINVSFYRLTGIGYATGTEQSGKIYFNGFFDNSSYKADGYIEKVGEGVVRMVITNSGNDLIASGSEYTMTINK